MGCGDIIFCCDCFCFCYGGGLYVFEVGVYGGVVIVVLSVIGSFINYGCDSLWCFE